MRHASLGGSKRELPLRAGSVLAGSVRAAPAPPTTTAAAAVRVRSPRSPATGTTPRPASRVPPESGGGSSGPAPVPASGHRASLTTPRQRVGGPGASATTLSTTTTTPGIPTTPARRRSSPVLAAKEGAAAPSRSAPVVGVAESLARAVSGGTPRRQLPPRPRTASSPASVKVARGGEEGADSPLGCPVRRATLDGGAAVAVAASVAFVPTSLQQLQAPPKRLPLPLPVRGLRPQRDARPEAVGGAGGSSGVTAAAPAARAPAPLAAVSASRAMAPVVHVRVRPLLPEMGESNDLRKVWFLDHENVVVRGPSRCLGGSSGSPSAGGGAAGGAAGSGTRPTERRATLAPSRVRGGAGLGSLSPTAAAAAAAAAAAHAAAAAAAATHSHSPTSSSLTACTGQAPSGGARALHEEGTSRGLMPVTATTTLSTSSTTPTAAAFAPAAPAPHSRSVSEQSVLSEAGASGRTSPGRLSASSAPPLPLMQPSGSQLLSDSSTPRPQPRLTTFLARPATLPAGGSPRAAALTEASSPRSSPGLDVLVPRAMTGSSPAPSTVAPRRPSRGAAGLGGPAKVGGLPRRETRTKDGRSGTAPHPSTTSALGGLCTGGGDGAYPDPGAGHEQHFRFEFVHDERATQQEVFEDSVLRFADEALLAQNVAILCYGPTGSGKTFSMMGHTLHGGGAGGLVSRRQSMATGVTAGPSVSAGGPDSSLVGGLTGVATTACGGGAGGGGARPAVVDDRSPPIPPGEDGAESPPSGGRLAPASVSDWLEDSIAQVSAEDTEDDEWPMFDHTWYRDRQRRAQLMDASAAGAYGRGGAGVGAGDQLRSAEMGILPRLVRVLLDRRNDTVTLTSMESTTPLVTAAATAATTASLSSASPTAPGTPVLSTGAGPRATAGKRGPLSSASSSFLPSGSGGSSNSPRVGTAGRRAPTLGPSRRTVTLTLREITFYGVEIYCDELTDLMDPGKRPVTNVSDTGGLAALCARLDQARDEAVRAAAGHPRHPPAPRAGAGGGIPMESLEDLKRAYRLARRNRVTGAHAKNDVSSRSHAAFFLQLRFELAERTVCMTTGAVLSESAQPVHSYVAMVDLAGSERLKETQVESGRGLREAQYINKSLSALSSVVLALYQRSGHIPYRDSKLTRLLRPCLEGGRVLILVHVAPCSGANTLNTLKFADQVRHTLVQTHSFSGNANKQGLVNIFEDLIDPEQAKLEVAMTHAQETYDQLCAEVRLAHLSRAALPDGPRLAATSGRGSASCSSLLDSSLTLTTSNASSSHASITLAEPRPSLARLPADPTPAALRAYRVRTLCERHLAPLRESEDAGVQAAVRDMALERDRRVEAARRRLEAEALALRDGIAELTRFNARLALENASPLPTDPYCQELARQTRVAQDELRELQNHTLVLQSGVGVLRQRVGTQADIHAGVDADLGDMRGKGLLLPATTAAVTSMDKPTPATVATGVAAPHPTLAGGGSAGAAYSGGGGSRSPPPASPLTYVDSEVAADAEMREVGFQQVVLSQELSALRIEAACFELGDGILEGLWARAMRQELLTAVRVELALMERVLLDRAALSSLLTSARELLSPGDRANADAGVGGGGCGGGGGGGVGSGRGAPRASSSERPSAGRGEHHQHQHQHSSTPTSPLAGASRRRLSASGGGGGGGAGGRLSPSLTPRQGGGGSPMKATSTAGHVAGASRAEGAQRSVGEALAAVEAYLAQVDARTAAVGAGRDGGDHDGGGGGAGAPWGSPGGRPRTAEAGGQAPDREDCASRALDGETATREPEEGAGVGPWHSRGWLGAGVGEGGCGSAGTSTTTSAPLVVEVPNPLEAVWYSPAGVVRGVVGVGVGGPSPTRRRGPRSGPPTSPTSRRTSLAGAMATAFLPTSLVGSYDSEAAMQRASVLRMLMDGVPCEAVCVGDDYAAVAATYFATGGGSTTTASPGATAAVERTPCGADGEAAGLASDTGEDLASPCGDGQLRGLSNGTAELPASSLSPRPAAAAPSVRHWGQLRLVRKAARTGGGTRGSLSRSLPLSWTGASPAPASVGVGVGVGVGGGVSGGRAVEEAEVDPPVTYCLEFVYVRHGVPLPPRVADALSAAVSPAPRTQLEELVDALPSSMDVRRTHTPATGSTAGVLSPAAAALLKERRLFSIPLSEPQLSMNLHLLEAGSAVVRHAGREETGPQIALELRGLPLSDPAVAGLGDVRSPPMWGAALEMGVGVGGVAGASPGFASAGKDVMLAKRLREGGELLLPAPCIVANKEVCTLLLRFPGGTVSPSTQLESVEVVVAALCGVMPPAGCPPAAPPQDAGAPASAMGLVGRSGSGTPRPAPASATAAGHSSAGGSGGSGKPRRRSTGGSPGIPPPPSPAAGAEGAGETVDAGTGLVVRGHPHVPYVLLQPNPNPNPNPHTTAAAAAVTTSVEPARRASAPAVPRDSSPEPRRLTGARRASDLAGGRGGSGRSSNGRRSDSVSGAVETAVVRGAGLQIYFHFPGRTADHHVDLAQLLRGAGASDSPSNTGDGGSGGGGGVFALGPCDAAAGQILCAAMLLQGLRTVTLGPLVGSTDETTGASVGQPPPSSSSPSAAAAAAAVAGWRVVQRLQRLHTFTRHVRALVRRQIFAAEDIRADMTSRTDGGGRGGWGQHLRALAQDARETVGAVGSLGVGGGLLGGSAGCFAVGGPPFATPLRDGGPLQPPAATATTAVGCVSGQPRAVPLSLARELGTGVLPWTLWQWAYRWPAVQSLCQQLERAAWAAVTDAAPGLTPRGGPGWLEGAGAGPSTAAAAAMAGLVARLGGVVGCGAGTAPAALFGSPHGAALSLVRSPASIAFVAAAAAASAQTPEGEVPGSFTAAVGDGSPKLEPIVLPSSSDDDEVFGSVAPGSWMAESAPMGSASAAAKTVWLPELTLAPVPDFLAHMATAS